MFIEFIIHSNFIVFLVFKGKENKCSVNAVHFVVAKKELNE